MRAPGALNGLWPIAVPEVRGVTPGEESGTVCCLGGGRDSGPPRLVPFWDTGSTLPPSECRRRKNHGQHMREELTSVIDFISIQLRSQAFGNWLPGRWSVDG